MLLEICTATPESVKAAYGGGADRIELCENLHLGGTTPGVELIKTAVALFGRNTQILLRPRAGNFIYNAAEIDQICNQIDLVRELGAGGVVVGALTKDHRLDRIALKKMIIAAADTPISFHKAIDEVVLPDVAIESLIDLGFARILSSGGKSTAQQGLENLIAWQQNYGDQIEIMPGGSIRPQNIEFFKGHGFASVHSAAVPKGQKHSSEAVIKQLLAAINP